MANLGVEEHRRVGTLGLVACCLSWVRELLRWRDGAGRLDHYLAQHHLPQLRRVMRRLPEPPDVLPPHPRSRWRLSQLEPLRIEIPERHLCSRRDARNHLRPLRVRLAQVRLRNDAVVVGMVGVDEDGDDDAALFRPFQKALERLEAFAAVLARGEEAELRVRQTLA